MGFIDKIKDWFKKKESVTEFEDGSRMVSVAIMEKKYEEDDLVGAAKDLKVLLEHYGTSIKKNHRHKGREFIHFILTSKHKNLKNQGYKHWQNLNQIIILNHKKVYPYHKNNLREAMTFFEKEIKSINSIHTIAQ